MTSGWTLVRPDPAHAAVVASWPTSADEVDRWVSRRDHPFAAETVQRWWGEEDVHPWLLVDAGGAPVAYGELWDDAAEDEVELARLIVDPSRRGAGAGRRLVDELLDLARRSGRGACFLRVRPDNVTAASVYLAAGFVDVDPALADEWNAAQPVAYRWMQHPSITAKEA